MAKISLKFVNRSGRFCLCATVVGTSVRHYRVVDELKNPNFDSWDKVSQRFVSRRAIDQENNKILNELVGHYQNLMSVHEFSSGKELFDFQEESDKFDVQSIKQLPTKMRKPCASHSSAKESKATGPTFREWINQIVEDIKHPTRLKPSSAYQVYLSLLRKMEMEKRLIDQPISAIDDETYAKFMKWAAKQGGKDGKGGNYINTMKAFNATINRARKARLINYRPEIPYMDYAPIRSITDKAEELLSNGGAIKSITLEQYEAFVALDLSKVPLNRGPHMAYYKELYRDFCILLYEMKSRPIDVLRLHWDNIAYDEHTKRFTCTYIPAKKKNYGASAKSLATALAIQYLSPKAVEVIMKYKGKSKGGYVFPFSLNDTRWNFDNPQDYHYHYYRGNRICGNINHFLHKVGVMLGVPFQLTMYAFRRAAITKAITDNRMPIAMIAKTAGTSIEMIEAHYANYLQALAEY